MGGREIKHNVFLRGEGHGGGHWGEKAEGGSLDAAGSLGPG